MLFLIYFTQHLHKSRLIIEKIDRLYALSGIIDIQPILRYTNRKDLKVAKWALRKRFTKKLGFFI